MVGYENLLASGVACRYYRKTCMADLLYDPAERAREKQAARDLDEQQIASGEKTPAQVQQQNAAFAFPGARVKFRKR